MTSETIPIYEGQDFYVPHFQLVVNDRVQGPQVMRDVVQVSYQDNIDSYDTCSITINNWDAEKRTFKYSNESTFDPGKRLELWMGYYGPHRLRRMLRGKILSLQPNFPSSGQPTLAINCRNLLHEFQTKQESAVYENKTDSQIAKQIGRRLNVEVRTEPTAEGQEQPYKQLVQRNEYDIVYLMKRAARIGYDLFVEEDDQARDRLYFGPSENVNRVVYALSYGRSLIDFRPTLNITNQVNEVTVRGSHPTGKTTISYTAKRSPIITNGQVRFQDAFKQRQEVVVDKPLESIAEARQLATETLERIAKEFITGSGSIVGLPDLRAGSVVQIDGLDQLFNGRYFVTSTTHTLNDSGYSTTFQCRLEQR